MVPTVANEVDTSMKLTDTVHTCGTPRLGVQPAIPFQQVHPVRSVLTICLSFLVPGYPTEIDWINFRQLQTSNFIHNGTKSLLATTHFLYMAEH